MFVIPLSRSSVSATQRAALAPQFGRAVDRLFDESLARAFGRPASSADTSRSPAMDVSESDTHYTVAFDVPGATREGLKVSVEGRRVSLNSTPSAAPAASTEPAQPEPTDAARVLYRERGAPHYARTVSLPAEVDQASSQAKFENGVLTLTLAKKVPAGAAQIAIN